MTRDVRFAPEARDDLRALAAFIADRSGAGIASRYVARIGSRCAGLRDFPERGASRDELLPGLRVIGFERRVTIAYLVTPDAVTILRVLYGGRDIEAALRQR